jgi:hypothetical protein
MRRTPVVAVFALAGGLVAVPAGTASEPAAADSRTGPSARSRTPSPMRPASTSRTGPRVARDPLRLWAGGTEVTTTNADPIDLGPVFPELARVTGSPFRWIDTANALAGTAIPPDALTSEVAETLGHDWRQLNGAQASRALFTSGPGSVALLWGFDPRNQVRQLVGVNRGGRVFYLETSPARDRDQGFDDWWSVIPGNPYRLRQMSFLRVNVPGQPPAQSGSLR